MNNYLQRLYKVNQEIKDPAEFANFENAARFFLRSTDIDHKVYISSIIKTLQKKTNREILRLAYGIASELEIKDSFIGAFFLERDFKRIETRSTVMKYLLKYKIEDFDEKIKVELSKKRLILDQNTFDYFKQKDHLVKEFMFDEKKENLFIQFDLITNSHVFYNISYFIQFLGNESKFICLKAFEAFSIFFECINNKPDDYRNDIEKVINTDLNTPMVRDSTNSRFYLVIELNTLDIQSLQNFIIFGFNFLKERDSILELVHREDRKRAMIDLFNLIGIYCRSTVYEQILIFPYDLLQISRFTKPIELIFEDNGSFDHLFEKNNRKDICDCIEF